MMRVIASFFLLHRLQESKTMVIREPQPRLKGRKFKSGLYFNFRDLEPWLDVNVASNV